MIFFTSDIHFSDETTLKSDLRPFKNTKHFDKHIIKTWNKQAKKTDTIYVVGDLLDCDGENHDVWKKSSLLIKKVKANIILIMGNNEDRIVKYFFNNNFDLFKEYCLNLGIKEVYKNLTVKIKDNEFYLTHKPLDYNPDFINLFGHTHAAGGIYKPFGLNVSCDLHHYRLLSEDDIFHLLAKKEKFWNKDKHLNM